MASVKAKTRRRYSSATKAQVMAQCAEPGASVAKVAMAHGINANVVHRWRQLAREGQATATHTGEFIALPLGPLPSAAPVALSAPADIRIELCRGPLTMRITWPVSAAVDFAAWSRELLR